MKYGQFKSKYPRKNNPIYVVWSGMMRRCYNKKSKNYKEYGKRGIYVCEEWHDYDCFYEDMAEKFSTGLTLDRIDNNGPYCKENTAWVSRKSQALNRRSNHCLLNPKTGESKTIQEWCEIFGLNRTTVNSRIHILKLTRFDLIFSTKSLPRNIRHDYDTHEMTRVTD